VFACLSVFQPFKWFEYFTPFLTIVGPALVVLRCIFNIWIHVESSSTKKRRTTRDSRFNGVSPLHADTDPDDIN